MEETSCQAQLTCCWTLWWSSSRWWNLVSSPDSKCKYEYLQVAQCKKKKKKSARRLFYWKAYLQSSLAVLAWLAWNKNVLVFGRLMLMALYNVSISVKGLKHISESPETIPVIWTLLDGKDTLRKRYSPGMDPSVLRKTKNRTKDGLNCTNQILRNETFHLNLCV